MIALSTGVSRMGSKMVKGYTFAILSAVIYGCMPLMAKFIYAEGVTPMMLVFLRNALALPSLLILALCTKSGLRISAKSLPSLCFLAFFGCVITPILLFSSYNYMASGAATVLHFVYPALVLILGALFFKKRIPLWSAVSVALCVIGVALFYNPNEPISLSGSILSLGSGLTFAIYVAFLPRLRMREIGGFSFSFYIALASSIITLILCVATGNFTPPTSLLGFGLCALFATAVTTGAVVLFQQGTFLIGSEKTAVLSSLEPITGVIVGVIVFAETLQLNTLFGCVLVIAASFIIAISDLVKNKKHSQAE